jgi:hypothetical protein
VLRQSSPITSRSSVDFSPQHHLLNNVVTSWGRDQFGARDIEIMWMNRRRQLLIDETMQKRKWQTRPFNRCMQILRTEEAAQIKRVTPELIVWVSQDGWEHQAVRVDLKFEEGPDPQQFSLKDWIDPRRQ